MDLYQLIQEAKQPSPWDSGNKVLYEMCRDKPAHNCVPEVIAKVWLIGRVYAAAIERRKEKNQTNEEFYTANVAPKIIESDIDIWITRALETASWSDIISAHENTMHLFGRISGLDKRSLASKYLHFHAPNLFYIYDSRAVNALRSFGKFIGRAAKYKGVGDNEYRKFAEKCRSLQAYITTEFDSKLTPRELDNLLLAVQKKPNKAIEADA